MAESLDKPKESKRSILPRIETRPDAFGQVAEGTARFMGTPKFLAYMTVFCLVWLAWNSFGPPMLRFDKAVPVDGIVESARRAGVPLDVLDLSGEDLPGAYRHALVLSRPDRHVAWRGDRPVVRCGAVLQPSAGVRGPTAGPRCHCFGRGSAPGARGAAPGGRVRGHAAGCHPP